MNIVKKEELRSDEENVVIEEEYGGKEIGQ